MSDDTAPEFVPLIDDAEALDIIVSSFARDLDRVTVAAEVLVIPMDESALRASLDGL